MSLSGITHAEANGWLADSERRAKTAGRKVMVNNNPHNVWNMDLLLSTFVSVSAGDVTMEEVCAIENMEVGETVQFYIFKIKRTV